MLVADPELSVIPGTAGERCWRYCYERGLAEARDVAMREMQERAQALGANAGIGIDLDYEVLGQNNGMLMVAVSGTAVVVG